jgi:hypothetical protein
MLRAAIFAIAITAMTSSCYHPSADEERVVGTWLYTGMDAFGRITFTRDHKVLFCFPDAREQPCDPKWTAHGTWRISGEDVVYNIDYSALSGPTRQRKDETLPLRWFRAGAAPATESNFKRVR